MSFRARTGCHFIKIHLCPCGFIAVGPSGCVEGAALSRAIASQHQHHPLLGLLHSGFLEVCKLKRLRLLFWVWVWTRESLLEFQNLGHTKCQTRRTLQEIMCHLFYHSFLHELLQIRGIWLDQLGSLQTPTAAQTGTAPTVPAAKFDCRMKQHRNRSQKHTWAKNL